MKNLVLAIAIGLFSLPSFAQECPPHRGDKNLSAEQKARKMALHMGARLNLSDEQIKELLPALEEFHKKEEQARAERKQRKEELKADLAEILDEEQMAKMEKKMEQRKGKMRRHRFHKEMKLEEAEEIAE